MKTRGIPAAVSAVASLLLLSSGVHPRWPSAGDPAPQDRIRCVGRIGSSHLTLDDAIDIALHRNPANPHPVAGNPAQPGPAGRGARCGVASPHRRTGTFNGTDNGLVEFQQQFQRQQQVHGRLSAHRDTTYSR